MLRLRTVCTGMQRTGEKDHSESKYALDKYHMHKYIIAATSHLEDSAEDARGEIYRAIHRKKKWMAEGAFDRIIGITDKETKRKAVEQAKAYILGNWSGIMIAMKSGDSNVRCSVEGHVSHVYADRMSSIKENKYPRGIPEWESRMWQRTAMWNPHRSNSGSEKRDWS